MGIRRIGFFGIPTPEVEMLVGLRADVSAKDRRNKNVVHCCCGWVGVRKDTHVPLEVFVRPKMSRVFFPQRFIGRLILIIVDVTNRQLKWLVSYEIQSASSNEGICNSIQTNLEKSREIIMKTGPILGTKCLLEGEVFLYIFVSWHRHRETPQLLQAF